MMKTTIWIMAGLFVAVFGQSAQAEECTTGTAPVCVEGSGYFDNKDEEQSCRDAVKAYQKTVSDFWICQREKGNAVNNESRKVIRLINCRIRGKETCE